MYKCTFCNNEFQDPNERLFYAAALIFHYECAKEFALQFIIGMIKNGIVGADEKGAVCKVGDPEMVLAGNLEVIRFSEPDEENICH